MGYAERARNALYALAAGDALGWPAFYHRTYALPFWTRRLRREIDAAQEERGILRFPMPFSLNRATESLQFYPTDDTEWACFTADMLFACGGQLTREFVAETWEQLANAATEVRGTISIQGALHNFREGLQPPVTGRDNPHYFDDGACSRAVVIGIAFPGRSQEAAMSAEIDGEVTNAFDGLWAAQAVAAALAAACGGASLEEALAAALQVLPQDSWVKRVSEEALRGGEAFGLGLVPYLDRLVNKEYSYGGAAPEVLALTLAVAKAAQGNLERGILLANTFPKLADSLPALVGALCGALCDEPVPWLKQWEPVIDELHGLCLPRLKGRSWRQVVDRLVEVGIKNGGLE
ncbi:MAG TPA: ADP-ribosylglycohydrolase family protein [Firmicutes bacterium]|jgi:ADP-ribosylglycohydrolase|nr:ADP-ribosylglycohydrolase family protein [Bacillota bacterium]